MEDHHSYLCIILYAKTSEKIRMRFS